MTINELLEIVPEKYRDAELKYYTGLDDEDDEIRCVEMHIYCLENGEFKDIVRLV